MTGSDNRTSRQRRNAVMFLQDRRREVCTDRVGWEGELYRWWGVCTDGVMCVQTEGIMYRRREGFIGGGRCVQA